MSSLPVDVVIHVLHDAVRETARLGAIAAAHMSNENHPRTMDELSLIHLRDFILQGLRPLDRMVADAANRSRTESIVLASQSPSAPRRRDRSEQVALPYARNTIGETRISSDPIDPDSQSTIFDPIENSSQ